MNVLVLKRNLHEKTDKIFSMFTFIGRFFFEHADDLDFHSICIYDNVAKLGFVLVLILHIFYSPYIIIITPLLIHKNIMSTHSILTNLFDAFSFDTFFEPKSSIFSPLKPSFILLCMKEPQILFKWCFINIKFLFVC